MSETTSTDSPSFGMRSASSSNVKSVTIPESAFVRMNRGRDKRDMMENRDPFCSSDMRCFGEDGAGKDEGLAVFVVVALVGNAYG